jgi:gliding motility-associated-like protein
MNYTITCYESSGRSWMAYLEVCFFPLVLMVAFLPAAGAQDLIILEECGVSYIDPQDAMDDDASPQDTLIYTTYFEENNLLRAFYVDINAFGGQQVDRGAVYGIMPDSSLKYLGGLAFGNCADCVEGFAFVQDDSLLTSSVNDRTVMDRWLQSLNQPAFALPGNLQTLRGVGRISGRLPFCAVGMRVEFIVNGNPQSTTTEFSAHVICPEVLGSCSIEKEVVVDCQRDSIFLSAELPAACFSGEAEVRWYNDKGWSANAAQASLSLSGNEGVYFLWVADECCEIIDSVLVENPVFADAGPDEQACLGAAVAISGTGMLDSYWESPQGALTDGPVFTLSGAQPAQEGAYIFHTFNEEGCEDTDTLQLTVRTPPSPDISIETACLGDTLHLELQNAAAYTQVRWLNPSGVPLSESFLPDFQVADAGPYTLTVTDTVGCEVSEVVEVTAKAPPDYEYLIEESCDSARVFFTPGAYRYAWGDGERGNPLVTATGGAFSVTITDAEGCSSINLIDIPPPDGPDVRLEVTQPRCPKELGIVEVIAEQPGRPLIFSTDGGATYSVSPRFEELPPGPFSVLVQDQLGCVQQLTTTIQRPDTMGVRLKLDELTVRPTTTVSLGVETAGNIQLYQWLPKEIDSGGPTTRFTATTNLDIRIIVEDDRGCRATDGLPLTVVVGPNYIPNAFSPNGDGINDYFTFFSDLGSGEIIEFLQVYNRAGGMVFEATEIGLNDESLGWDGTFLGKPMNAGVFAFYGIVRFGNGERKAFKGDVTLIR